MEEQVKKAFDFAADSTKQLITLSTAILTLTITFGKDVLQKVDSGTKQNLTYSWVVYLLSIFFGILTLLALTGTLDPIKKKKKQAAAAEENVDATTEASAKPDAAAPEKVDQRNPVATIQGANVRLFSTLQIVTFLLATALVVISGITALRASGPSSTTTTAANIEQIVRNKQRLFVEALLRRDTAAIEQNLAPDSVLISNLGQVMNRNHLTSALNSAELTYEVINVDDVSVRIYGDTAVQSGHAMVKGRYKEQSFDGQFRFSVVFAKGSQDSWQAVGVQVARLDQPVSSQPPKVAKRTSRFRGRKSSRKAGRRITALFTKECSLRRLYVDEES
jgi:ketosteroid isomerase-like protein